MRQFSFISLQGKGGLRLSPAEVEQLFDFCFSIHDHEAKTPAQVIHWERLEFQLAGKWVN